MPFLQPQPSPATADEEVVPMEGRKHSLIYETVLEHIKTELLASNLKPGDRLPTVAALSKQLGVGQASVREAYRVLETMGILEVRQGRGTTLSSRIQEPARVLNHFDHAQQQSVSNLLEARKVLEPGVAALAAQRATEAEADGILKAAEEMERLHEQGEDFTEPDIRFHELIFAAAHNPTLARPLLELHEFMWDIRRLALRIPGAVEKTVHFHKLIALAIKEGNPEAAQALMYQHIEDAERRAVQSLEKTPSEWREGLAREDAARLAL